MNRPISLLFDVNETLLDLSPLAGEMESVFGSPSGLGEWFARLLHGTLVANEIDHFRPFSVIGVEALIAMARKRGQEIDESRAVAIVDGMTELAVHPDVMPAMERLVDAGFKTAAVTNGSTDAANAQIEHAGLHPFIQRVISVDEVGRFKPDPSTYQYAAALLEVQPSDAMLIAAHDWDVAGAVRAGVRGAYVKRSGSWSIQGLAPELVAADLTELADILLER